MRNEEHAEMASKGTPSKPSKGSPTVGELLDSQRTREGRTSPFDVITSVLMGKDEAASLSLFLKSTEASLREAISELRSWRDAKQRQLTKVEQWYTEALENIKEATSILHALEETYKKLANGDQGVRELLPTTTTPSIGYREDYLAETHNNIVKYFQETKGPHPKAILTNYAHDNFKGSAPRGTRDEMDEFVGAILRKLMDTGYVERPHRGVYVWVGKSIPMGVHVDRAGNPVPGAFDTSVNNKDTRVPVPNMSTKQLKQLVNVEWNRLDAMLDPESEVHQDIFGVIWDHGPGGPTAVWRFLNDVYGRHYAYSNVSSTMLTLAALGVLDKLGRGIYVANVSPMLRAADGGINFLRLDGETKGRFDGSVVGSIHWEDSAGTVTLVELPAGSLGSKGVYGRKDAAETTPVTPVSSGVRPATEGKGESSAPPAPRGVKKPPLISSKHMWSMLASVLDNVVPDEGWTTESFAEELHKHWSRVSPHRSNRILQTGTERGHFTRVERGVYVWIRGLDTNSAALRAQTARKLQAVDPKRNWEQVIMSLMAQDATRTWGPSTIKDELYSRGIEVGKTSVYNLLQNLLTDKLIHRKDVGQYFWVKNMDLYAKFPVPDVIREPPVRAKPGRSRSISSSEMPCMPGPPVRTATV